MTAGTMLQANLVPPQTQTGGFGRSHAFDGGNQVGATAAPQPSLESRHPSLLEIAMENEMLTQQLLKANSEVRARPHELLADRKCNLSVFRRGLALLLSPTRTLTLASFLHLAGRRGRRALPPWRISVLFSPPWALTLFRLDPRAEQVMRLSSMVSFLNGQGNQQDLSQGDKARKGREQVRCPGPLFLMLLPFSCEDDATWRWLGLAHPVTILALIIASRIHQIYIRAGTAVFPLDFLDLTRKFAAPPPQPRLETSSHDHGIGLTRSKPCSSRP
jgi:hypothetical protein